MKNLTILLETKDGKRQGVSLSFEEDIPFLAFEDSFIFGIKELHRMMEKNKKMEEIVSVDFKLN